MSAGSTRLNGDESKTGDLLNRIEKIFIPSIPSYDTDKNERKEKDHPELLARYGSIQLGIDIAFI